MNNRIKVNGKLYEAVSNEKNIEPRKIDDEVEALFDELVPMSGKSKVVAGEIIRALCRIVYRWYNDGDCIGVGYGNETCNPAARYLINYTPSNSGIPRMVSKLWGKEYDKNDLNRLSELVVDYIEDNPKLKDKRNTVDMWDLYDPDEDVDPEQFEDEDDYYDEEDW